MKRDAIDGVVFAATPKDVTALAQAIMTHTDAEVAGRATYMRSLLAGTQIELIGKPVIRQLRNDRKTITIEAAAAAFEKVQAVYYEAVLAAVPDGLDAKEKQSKTSFARSAASTLRRALRLGWNPLTPISEASKVTLSRYVKEHAEPRTPTVPQAERRVASLVEKIQETLKALPARDAADISRAALVELGGEEPQRLTAVSLRKHEPARPAAH